jgi:hypothetical protein
MEEKKYVCGDYKNRSCGLSGKVANFALCGSCAYSVGAIEDDCIPDNTKIYSGENPLGEILQKIN